MRIAAAQLTAHPGDVAANVAAHVELIDAAAAEGAALVAFPELSLTGYELDRIASDPELTLAEDDERLQPLKDATASTGVTAVVGLSMPTANAGEKQLVALAIRPDGTTLRGAKTHLHGQERELFVPGERPAIFSLEGQTVALAVCVDAAHPEHAAAAARQGAEIYVCGALFEHGSEHRIDEQAGGRARETGMAFVFALTTGPAGPFDTRGQSGVWDGQGNPLVRLGAEGPAVAVAHIPPRN